MNKLSDIEQETLNRFEEFLYKKSNNPKMLVQIIELAGDYLNLQTISNYAKENNISYNGVKKCRNTVTLFDVKFVIDND